MKRTAWSLALLPLAVTILTGCTANTPAPPRPATGASAAPSAGQAPRAVASPRSTGPDGQSLPPSIGTAGASGPPPAIPLPPPAESRPAVERRNLVELLGYELTDAGGATDPIRVMDVATWAPTRVRVVTGPTDYALTRATEHVADLVAFHVLPLTNPDRPPAPAWFALPAVSKDILQRKLGASVAEVPVMLP